MKRLCNSVAGRCETRDVVAENRSGIGIYADHVRQYWQLQVMSSTMVPVLLMDLVLYMD